MTKLTLLILSTGFFILGACQAPWKLGQSIELQMPIWTTHHFEWWEEFQTQAQFLQIHIFCENQLTWSERFEPSQWKNVRIPQAPCSQAAEFLKIQASFWGKRVLGEQTHWPLLEGSIKIEAEETLSGNSLIIPMNFLESPKQNKR